MTVQQFIRHLMEIGYTVSYNAEDDDYPAFIEINLSYGITIHNDSCFVPYYINEDDELVGGKGKTSLTEAFDTILKWMS